MRKLLVVALTVSAMAGCKDSSGPTGLVGEWSLAKVNAAPLPYVVYTNPATNSSGQIVASSLTLDSDGTFTLVTENETRINGVLTNASDDVVTVTGTYTSSGSEVTLTATGGEQWQYVATVAGAKLTFTVVDRAMEYAK